MKDAAFKPPCAPTLDRHGAASRCLLRLRENLGRPGLSDAEFLRRYADSHPQWATHPGELDVAALGKLACEIGVAGNMTVTTDYAETLAAHRLGQAVIVAIDCAPLPQTQHGAARPHRMVLEHIDEDGFVVWCPFESGASDLLPRADRIWWQRWQASACIFHPKLPAAV